MSTLPKVFPLESKELEIRDTIYDIFRIFIESNDFTNVYSITLTLTPAEIHFLRKNKKNVCIDEPVQSYIEFLLRQYGIYGINTMEYTKKGIEHIHGLFYEKNNDRNLIKCGKKRGKTWHTYYTDSRIGSHHMIKKISTNRQFEGWIGYMCKNQTPIKICDWFQLYGKDQYSGSLDD